MLLHSNSLSNKMDNSLLAVRVINHKYIVVGEVNILTRNLKIELYRVIFTFIIIVHHFQNSYDLHFMTNGYIAVDFFFILSY